MSVSVSISVCIPEIRGYLYDLAGRKVDITDLSDSDLRKIAQEYGEALVQEKCRRQGVW